MNDNQEIRDVLAAKGWSQIANSNVVETWQITSYWKPTDAAKIGIYLKLVEDTTQSNTPPQLFIYSERDRWIPIKLDDLT